MWKSFLGKGGLTNKDVEVESTTGLANPPGGVHRVSEWPQPPRGTESSTPAQSLHSTVSFKDRRLTHPPGPKFLVV